MYVGLVDRIGRKLRTPDTFPHLKISLDAFWILVKGAHRDSARGAKTIKACQCNLVCNFSRSDSVSEGYVGCGQTSGCMRWVADFGFALLAVDVG